VLFRSVDHAAAQVSSSRVTWQKADAQSLPFPDGVFDAVVCQFGVMFFPDKRQAYREARRVLKPGGRLAVSDVVVRGAVPAEIRRNIELWVGCIAGALEDHEYSSKLAQAGFQNIDIEPTRVYHIDDARQFLTNQGVNVDAIAPQVDGKFMSAFIRATKP
jgi:ubiquinone/menaquinone biosynthesis C-methylase UbiE